MENRSFSQIHTEQRNYYIEICFRVLFEIEIRQHVEQVRGSRGMGRVLYGFCEGNGHNELDEAAKEQRWRCSGFAANEGKRGKTKGRHQGHCVYSSPLIANSCGPHPRRRGRKSRPKSLLIYWRIFLEAGDECGLSRQISSAVEVHVLLQVLKQTLEVFASNVRCIRAFLLISIVYQTEGPHSVAGFEYRAVVIRL